MIYITTKFVFVTMFPSPSCVPTYMTWTQNADHVYFDFCALKRFYVPCYQLCADSPVIGIIESVKITYSVKNI